MKSELENTIEELLSIVEQAGQINPAQAIVLNAEIKVYTNLYDRVKGEEYLNRMEKLR